MLFKEPILHVPLNFSPFSPIPPLRLVHGKAHFLFFFFLTKTPLCLILSITALGVSAICAIRPSCYSLTHVPSQSDSLCPPRSLPQRPLLGYTSSLRISPL